MVWQAALAADKTHVSSWAERGSLRKRMGDFLGSSAAYTRCLMLDESHEACRKGLKPSLKFLKTQRSAQLRVAAGDHNAAIRMLRGLTRVATLDPTMSLTMARSLLAIGHYPEVLREVSG